jgi:hypothetical protein
MAGGAGLVGEGERDRRESDVDLDLRVILGLTDFHCGLW